MGWTGRIYQDQDFIQYLERTDEAWLALKLPPEQRFAELKAIASDRWPRDRPRTIASGMTALTDILSSRAEEDATVIARLGAARVALAILRWRAAHGGTLPEPLGQLVPDTLPVIPDDPFDEQLLRYRRLSQGFTVYSVGPDFADNGGSRPTLVPGPASSRGPMLARSCCFRYPQGISTRLGAGAFPGNQASQAMLGLWDLEVDRRSSIASSPLRRRATLGRTQDR